jgi:malonate decarboxylase epsilon subunit
MGRRGTVGAAFIYPGQGAQTPGMLAALPDVDAVRATIAEAAALLSTPVAELDSPATLGTTSGSQLALLVCGVAAARALAAQDARPGIVAGHSLGAFSAAVAAGVLDFAEAIDAVNHRARRMAELFPSGYGMVAVSGVREAEARRIAEVITGEGAPVWLANINNNSQMVFTGADDALGRAVELARIRGAQQIRPLAVPVPSHAPILEPVSAELRSLLERVPRRKMRATYVSISRARPTRDSEEVLEDLAVSVSRTVRWRDVFGVITELGTHLVLQLPPGHTLVHLALSDQRVGVGEGVSVRAMGEDRFDDCVDRVRRAASKA